jgi:type VI secretion system protein VasD
VRKPEHLVTTATAMIHFPGRLAVASMMVALAAFGCGKAPPPPAPVVPPVVITAPPAPVKASMTITVSQDANPDANGRPSPVYLRVYQLRGESEFKGAEFFDVWDDERKVLGSTLVSREEFFLKAGEQRTVDVAVASDATFVGVIAELRDIRNAEWRALSPVARGGLTVAITRGGVTLHATP